jgi:hypothetical protein
MLEGDLALRPNFSSFHVFNCTPKADRWSPFSVPLRSGNLSLIWLLETNDDNSERTTNGHHHASPFGYKSFSSFPFSFLPMISIMTTD